MQVEIIMPKMGESIQEGTILRWAKQIGEKIEKDETILEISTDKVDSEIPSPVAGILSRIVAKEQDTVPVGAIIAYIETNQSLPNNIAFVESTSNGTSIISNIHQPSPSQSTILSRKGSLLNTHKFYSPLVRSIAGKEGIGQNELDRIPGSGSNGRVTKQDILAYLERKVGRAEPKSSEGRVPPIASISLEELQKKYPSPKYQVVRMDNIHKKMADHMVRSVSTSPHVTVVDEVDMTSIVNFRLSILQKFEKQEGMKLTFMPFFGIAVVNALKEFPIVNSSLEGDAIIYKNFINLGIAVASPSGLIVPVIHQAGEKSFSELAHSLTDLAARARKKKLLPNEITDGTFSITNYGVFGSIIGTPIINQPQAAILGIGVIKKQPMVIPDSSGNDAIEIRSMAYLTLSFDHRIIDGAIGGQFLSRIKWYLEHFDFDVLK
jgi:2-oxoglutarate dehydrogenase complex dihydrolipoamide succinyltransferase (E2) component